MARQTLAAVKIALGLTLLCGIEPSETKALEAQNNINRSGPETQIKSTTITSPPQKENSPPTNEQPQKKAIEKLNAISVSYGKFATGIYSPYEPYGSTWRWDDCSAITFCTSDGLYGDLFSLGYTRRIYNGKTNKFDVDIQAYLAGQVDTTGVNNQQRVTGTTEHFFGMIAIVPTYRVKLPRPLNDITLGAGLGINLATGQVPSDLPYNNPVNSQVNLEIAATPLKDKTLQLTFALQHRCSFFGILNSTDGSNTGSQWWSIGLRKWL